MHRWRTLLAAACAGAMLAGCGSSPVSPTGSPSTPRTAPQPAPPGTSSSPPPAPAAFAVSSLQVGPGQTAKVNFVDRPVTFSWSAAPDAASYVVGIGTTAGSADVLAVPGGATTVTAMIPGDGHYYAHVKAVNSAGESPASSSIELYVISFKDYVEALFLGTGPQAQSPQSGCAAGTGRMSGWPNGSQVTVTLASSLTGAQQSAAASAASQASQATLGTVHTVVRTTADAHPVAGTFEITAQQADMPCASPTAAGCASPTFSSPGVFSSGAITTRANANPMPHETGHALYGFCHLNPNGGAFLASVMGWFNNAGTGLSEADMAAVQAVYQSGLRGGATRAQFAGAGLIKP